MINMKKFLSLVLVLCMVSFVGVINVNAEASSKMEKLSKSEYKYSWSGITDFSSNNYTYKLKCSNVSITNFFGMAGGDQINASEGYVNLKSNVTSGTLTCNIYKDDPNSENPVLTTASIVIGTTTTITKSTTSSATTTTAPNQDAPKSNNANLKSLKITGNDDSEVLLTPEFKPDIYEYSADVPSTTKLVNITPEMDDSNATMLISDNADKELKPGENNKITITVTAENGQQRVYTINIKREALTADATLKELTIKEDKSFKLKDNKFVYTVKVKKNVKELHLSYVLSDDKAEIEIDGNENLKDGSKVKITVIAEDGTKKVYTLNISKETTTTTSAAINVSTEKNPLIIMALSIIAFGLIGGIIYVIKK